ncbi:MAG: class D sortase [Defluviitaleaceae bacterium]|nr:class D sortase [Defluviitaleaceae bacterium]
MKIKTIVLVAVILTAFCVGVWFLVSPSFNRQANLNEQSNLLGSILAVMPDYEADVSENDNPTNEYEAIIPDDDGYANEYQDELYIPNESHESEEQPEICPPLEPLNPADFPNGIIPIGILTIDRIGLKLPIMDGVKEPELRIAPGHIPQTAVIGEIGNAVIAGHRNYTFGSMFNRLNEMENGDVIGFQAMSGQYMAFEVFEILVITPDNQIAFIQPQNESIITLYTCTPIREATHRLLVRAKKIEGGQ